MWWFQTQYPMFYWEYRSILPSTQQFSITVEFLILDVPHRNGRFNGPVKITNLGVTKFSRKMNTASGQFEVLQLVRENNVEELSQGKKREVMRMQEHLKKYEALFQCNLRSGFPSKKDVGHEIVLEESEKPPNWPLF